MKELPRAPLRRRRVGLAEGKEEVPASDLASSPQCWPCLEAAAAVVASTAFSANSAPRRTLRATATRRRARRHRAPTSAIAAVARWVARRGFHPDSGARELRRVVEAELEARLADLVLDGGLRRRVLVQASIRRGELHLAPAA